MAQPTVNQIKRMRSVMLDAFPRVEHWESLVIALPNVTDLQQIVIGTNTTQIFNRVFLYVRTNNALLDLLRAANEDTNGTNDKIMELLAEFEAGSAAAETAAALPGAVDHYETVLLSDFQMLLNRKPLRATAKRLGQEPGTRVFAISGPPGSGRSYSTQFMDVLSVLSRAFLVIKIDVNHLDAKGADDPTVDPVAIGRDIVEKIRWAQDRQRRAGDLPEGFIPIDLAAMPTPGREQHSRWGDRFSRWLAGQTGGGDLPWWIVLDGLDESLIGEDGHDLILRLAKVAREARPTWRLILIGYTQREKLENRLDAPVDREEIDLDALHAEREQRVAETLTILYVGRERSLGREPDQEALRPIITEAISRVAAKAPENGEGWLRTLGAALKEEAQRAYAENGAVTPANGGGL